MAIGPVERTSMRLCLALLLLVACGESQGHQVESGETTPEPAAGAGMAGVSGPLEEPAAAGAAYAAGDGGQPGNSIGVGGVGVGGDGGSRDPLQVGAAAGCPPPCRVELAEAPADGGFPPDAKGAAIFYDASREVAVLRPGTIDPLGSEQLVMFFTWEDNQYGYGEWTQDPWHFESIDPDVYDTGGYSRPENVEFTARVTNNDTLRIEATYSYAQGAVEVSKVETSP